MSENVTIIQMKKKTKWLVVFDYSNPTGHDVTLKAGRRKKVLTQHLVEESEDLISLDDGKISQAQRQSWWQIFPQKPKAEASVLRGNASAGAATNRPNSSSTKPGHESTGSERTRGSAA